MSNYNPRNSAPNRNNWNNSGGGSSNSWRNDGNRRGGTRNYFSPPNTFIGHNFTNSNQQQFPGFRRNSRAISGMQPISNPYVNLPHSMLPPMTPISPSPMPHESIKVLDVLEKPIVTDVNLEFDKPNEEADAYLVFKGPGEGAGYIIDPCRASLHGSTITSNSTKDYNGNKDLSTTTGDIPNKKHKKETLSEITVELESNIEQSTDVEPKSVIVFHETGADDLANNNDHALSMPSPSIDNRNDTLPIDAIIHRLNALETVVTMWVGKMENLTKTIEASMKGNEELHERIDQLEQRLEPVNKLRETMEILSSIFKAMSTVFKAGDAKENVDSGKEKSSSQ